MKKTTLWVAAAMALCLPVVTQAQADPADGKSPAAALRYESAFSDYQPWKAVSAGDWRAANQAVGAGTPAGAHSGHGSPAATPASAPAAQKPAAATSAPAHEGHTMPGGRK